ncbi:MAG: hypothetical protein WB297_18310 [Actinomycetota bacterium]
MTNAAEYRSEYCVQTPGSPPTVAPFATAAAKDAIHGVRTLGGERNMRRCGHGLPTADREVVQFLGPVGDTVVLNVEFLTAEWGKGGCKEPLLASRSATTKST